LIDIFQKEVGKGIFEPKKELHNEDLYICTFCPKLLGFLNQGGRDGRDITRMGK
jgi:hypothetical protein